jgi:cytochrome c-type biogenesis protein CcmH
MRRWALPFWTLLGVVLVGALIVGSGAFSGSPPTASQRASAIESVIRCPSCEDLSVAQSSASTAVAVRATVGHLIAEGWTDQQIEQFLVSRYGASIVLDPPARGLTLAVWLLPILSAVAVVSVLVTAMVRRQRAFNRATIDPANPTPDPSLDARTTSERRDFLSRSLADADAEYLSGDLDDADYLTLRRRDMARLAALGPVPGEAAVPVGVSAAGGVLVAEEPVPDSPPLVAQADVSTRPPARPARSRRSWWFLGGAVAAFGAALVLAVSLFATDRLPGQSATGSISLSQTQQVEETLAQAATYQDQGQAVQAAQLYQSVLAAHPDDEVALAQLGWLEYETGRPSDNGALISAGRTKLDRAVKLAPGDYAARLYLGTVLLQQDDDAAGAVAQYRMFLADGPPTALVEQAAPVISAAYQKAGLPLPSALASG